MAAPSKVVVPRPEKFIRFICTRQLRQKFTKLVDQDDRAASGVFEDCRGFAHLHKEGAFTCQNMVLGTDSREDSVHWSQFALFGRNWTTLVKKLHK
jgi:hypothetical protein